MARNGRKMVNSYCCGSFFETDVRNIWILNYVKEITSLF
jgi:hypothetical protein